MAHNTDMNMNAILIRTWVRIDDVAMPQCQCFGSLFLAVLCHLVWSKLCFVVCSDVWLAFWNKMYYECCSTNNQLITQDATLCADRQLKSITCKLLIHLFLVITLICWH